MPAMSSLLVNFLLFQLGWFSCVLGAAYQLPWLGLLIVMLILGFHLSRSGQPDKEFKLILLVLFIGFLWDSLLTWSGLLRYDNGQIHESLAPYWIIAMWALFASTLNVSLNWLKQRLLIASLFGLAGGPLAYYAGFKMGVVDFSNIYQAMLSLAFGWALIMPLLMILSTRFDGFNQQHIKLEVCDAGNL